MRNFILPVVVWFLLGFWVLMAQEVRQFHAFCIPKGQVEKALKEGEIRMVLELSKPFRESGVRIVIFRDKMGEYTIFEELSDGMMCLLTTGSGSRIGPAFG